MINGPNLMKLAQKKNRIGESGGERKKNPTPRPTQVYSFKKNLRRCRKEQLDLKQATVNYIYGHMTGILEQLTWESLKRGGEIVDSDIMLYKGLYTYE